MNSNFEFRIWIPNMHIGILTEGSIILILVEPETYSKILMAFVVNYEINFQNLSNDRVARCARKGPWNWFRVLGLGPCTCSSLRSHMLILPFGQNSLGPCN